MGLSSQTECLVRRCQCGDRAALERLFAEFQPRLRYYVRRLDKMDGQVEDILQDVWLKVIGRIESLRDPKAFPAWLYAIARNEVYGMFRARNTFAELTDEHIEQDSEDEPAFDPDDAARMHQAIETLKTHHREILTLSFMDDLSHDQIAELLNVPAGTVKSRLHYAKKALRKAMERNDGYETKPQR